MWVHILTLLALLQCREAKNDSRFPLEDVEGRIVGGSEVEPPHKYPFQVLLIVIALVCTQLILLQVYVSLGGYVCGGSILDTRHVLTACHCLYSYEGEMHSPRETFVYAGGHDRPGGQCGTDIGQAVRVKEFITQGNYEPKTFSHDLAVLRYS